MKSCFDIIVSAILIFSTVVLRISTDQSGLPHFIMTKKLNYHGFHVFLFFEKKFVDF